MIGRIAVIGVAIGVGLVPAAALASTYTVRACGAANAVNLSWTVVNQDEQHLESNPVVAGFPLCDPTRGLWGQDKIGPASDPVAGKEVDFTFRPAAGTLATGFSYDRYFFELDDDAWDPGFVRTAETPTSSPIEGQCTYDPTLTDHCSIDGTAVQSFATSRLEFGLRCSPGSVFGVPTTICQHGQTVHQAIAELHSAIVTISDANPPTVTSLTGAALTTPWPHGTLGLAAQAADASGIATFRPVVDGAPAGALVSGTCNTVPGVANAYTTPKPCADRTGANPMVANVDLSGLADGPHALSLQATDPAGNSAAAAAQTITTDQHAPGAPVSSSVTPAGPAATGWSQGPPTAMAWTNPGGQIAPIHTAYVRACKVAGTCVTTSTEGSSLDTSQLAALVSQGDGRYTLAVSLSDEAGNGTGFDVDRAVVRTVEVDHTPPAAPTSLQTTDLVGGWARPGRSRLVWTTPPGQASPLATSTVRGCREGGGCATGTFPRAGSISATELAALLNEGDGTYTVAVSLGDQAGNGAGVLDPSRAATTTLHVDRTPPAPPTGLTGAGTRATPTFALGWTLSATGPAPLASLTLRLCPPVGTCTTKALPPTATATAVTVPAADVDYRVVLWGRDQAGNEDPAHPLAGTVLYHPAPKPSARDTRLRITTARLATRTRRLTLAGTVAAGVRATGTLRVEAITRTGRRRRLSWNTRVVATPAGTFRRRLTLSPTATGTLSRARTVRARIHLDATTHWLMTTASHSVRRTLR
jgi:hypothetical protein